MTTSASFEYDAAGNRDDNPSSPTPWAYDSNNRLTASPGFTARCYDADGNQISTRSSGDCSTGTVADTFTWDTVNRLEGFSKSGTSASYLYDPFGRRIKKTVNGVATFYLWDGDRLLAEYDSSGVRQVRYAYAGGFAPVQVAYGSSPETIYDVHSDHLDTPRLLTDENGIAAWRASYEAFGQAHVSTDPDGSVVTPPPPFDFNIRFPGQYYDAETERWDPTLNGGAGGVVEGSGLHYNRFRYYDANVGRYISADPVGQRGGVNTFRYASFNPINVIDPFGLWTVNIENSSSQDVIDAVNKALDQGSSKIPLSDLLGPAGLPDDAQERIDKARGDVNLDCPPGEKSGKFTNEGEPINEELPDVPLLPASISIDGKLSGDFSVSGSEIDLNNIDGLSVDVPGPNPDVDRIRVTPGNVEITF